LGLEEGFIDAAFHNVRGGFQFSSSFLCVVRRDGEVSRGRPKEGGERRKSTVCEEKATRREGRFQDLDAQGGGRQTF